MIKLVKQGNYKILETWGETRILNLDDKNNYAWVLAKNIGEILVATKKTFNSLYTLSRGKYRLYQVTEEKNLIAGAHLELYVGEGEWQGYLLPTGLPKGKDIRNKIIPTFQIITLASNLRLVP